MADLLDTDVLLVNRAGVDYRVTKANMATVQDTDLILVNRAGVDYKATYADVKKGFGPGIIAPKPGDARATPGFVSGTGTQADPFIITPSTVGGAGGQAQSQQEITFSGLTTGSIVEWTDNSTGAGTRFKQAVGVVSGTTWTGHLTYSDQPPSGSAGTYTGNLQIGTTYFRWVVTQQTGVTPDLTAVTLSDVAGGGRFTSQAFPILAELDKDGIPVSTKKLKAWVQGTLKANPISSAITNVALGPLVDVFKTTLYTGNGGTQTITNGIDLAGNGGMVWTKCRSNSADHFLKDTVRGFQETLVSSATDASLATAGGSFLSDGYEHTNSALSTNKNGQTYASWTFRKAAKFFDVVTYTGNGAARAVAHSLGSAPGTIIVKRTDAAADWQVYHRSLANTECLVLNTTAAKATGTTRWNSTTPTSTEFSLGTDATVNANGATFVAYLFAHDPAGVIQCGSFTGNGSSQNISLGWEPQWMLVKASSNAGQPNWLLVDNMRGWPVTGNLPDLYANRSDAESVTSGITPTATGFDVNGDNFNENSQTYIYIAIKGPAQSQSTVLTLQDNTQLSNFASGESVTEVTAAGAAGDAKGGISAVDTAAKTITLSSSSGTWDIGSKVKGPKKAMGPNVKLYCTLDAAATVTDLQSDDPGFTAWPATATANPKIYSGTLTFPATLPTGQPPDTEMPAGTSLEVEVEASNASGADTQKSNTITPV